MNTMTGKRHIIMLLLLAAAAVCRGQILDIDHDKKIIYADSIRLSPMTPAKTVLSLLPELLERPTESLFVNYDIKLHGMSVGDARDVTLTQIRLRDIEKIEITEDPLSTYNNNGVGGSIDITMRLTSKTNDTLWGSAAVETCYPWDVMPQMSICYSKDRIRMAGIAMGEIYKATTTSTTTRYEDGYCRAEERTQTRERFYNNMARCYIYFYPTPQQQVKLFASEMSTADKYNFCTGEGRNRKTESKTTLQALAGYENSFKSGDKITAELQYAYSPAHSYSEDYESQLYDNRNRAHSVSGKLEFKKNMMCGKKTDNVAELTAGVNGSATWKNEEVENTNLIFYDAREREYLSDVNSFYVTPFVKFEGRYGRWRMKLQGNFQHFEYNVNLKDEPYNHVCNNVTAKMTLEWRVAERQSVRFIADRELTRPTERQIYPVMNYDPIETKYCKGNENLLPMFNHEVMIDYNGAFRWGRKTMQICGAVSYYHVSDIISDFVFKKTPPPGMIGLPMQYTSFVNDGHADIVSANVMARYRHGAFAVATTANVYHNRVKTGETSDHYDYFCVGVIPTVTWKKGWTAAVQMNYYSKVKAATVTTGDCVAGLFDITKTWETVSIHAFTRLSLTGRTRDVTRSGEHNVAYYDYRMFKNEVGVGIAVSL